MVNKTNIKTSGLRTWIELDRKAIKHNIDQFRSVIDKKTKLCAVVKSNAYGHGLVDFSKEVVSTGADFLAVDSVVEGLRLREEGIKLPIFILGYTLPERMNEAVDTDLSMTISNFENLREVIKIGKNAKIHIKVDTGMHRQGFMLSDSQKLLKILTGAKNKIEIEGLYTHFAAAKNPAFPDSTNKQILEFRKWAEIFKNAGLKPIVHAAATSGTLLFPQSRFDMVRIGIGLYGLWPSVETRAFSEKKGQSKNGILLKPVLNWKTIVSEIKILSDGGSVGYDFTETLSKKSKIAILPIGYWHGFPRALSGIGRVLINGQYAKVIGRVSMDMIVVDVTEIKNIKIGDEVVLVGKGNEAEKMAELANASWYEIITRLNPLIKKIFV